MTNVEMIDALRQALEVSYEEAKAALEQSNWDYNAALEALKQQGFAEAKQPETAAQEQQEAAAQEQPAAEEKSDDKSAMDLKAALRVLWDWIKWIITLACANSLVLRFGKREIMRLPVIVVALLLIFGFWWTLLILAVGLVLGLRYSFDGPNLGTKKINGFMSKIDAFFDKIKIDITSKKS